MTDTPTEEREAATPDAAATPVVATPAAPVPAAPEPVPFWNRPLVERFLVPLVLPIVVIVGLVAYVLNISRLFLSGHGHIPVFVGTAITVLILVGATVLAAGAPRMRQPAVTLAGAAFIFAIMSSGWLVLGHAQPEKTGPTTLPATLKTKQALAVTAAPGGKLLFAPPELKAKTGLATINVSVAGAGHTFTMQEATALFGQLSLDAAGSTVSGVAFFPTPGKYTFYCSVPGHEAAGMKGEITVTGPATTLAAALTADGNPPTAAG